MFDTSTSSPFLAKSKIPSMDQTKISQFSASRKAQSTFRGIDKQLSMGSSKILVKKASVVKHKYLRN